MYFKTNKYLLSAILTVIAANAVLVPLLSAGSGTGYTFIFAPALWILLAAVSSLAVKKTRKSERQRRDIKKWALYAAVLYIALSAVIGLFEGFGQSTADRSFFGFIKNMIAFAVPPVCCELVRAAATEGCAGKGKRSAAMCVETCIILALSQMDLGKFAGGLGTFSGAVRQIGGQLVPALAVSAMLTLFAVYAGSAPGIIYRLLTVVPLYILPVLPDKSWLLQALIGIFVPLVITLLMSYGLGRTKAAAKRDRKRDKPGIWIAVFSALLLVILFFAGALKYQPRVVRDPGMSPIINAGDVVILDRTEKAKNGLDIGDIAGYAKDGEIVFRRIVAARSDGGQPVYLMCGDSFGGADAEEVTQERIAGAVRARVPWVGRLMLRSNSGQTEEINIQA